MKVHGGARLLPEEINTDLHCSAKYLPGKDTAYIAQHAFEQIAPDFLTRFKSGDVIVAGKNFGINSSREQAVHVMRLLGAAAVVCPAFGRQFFRNAINNGLPVVECDISGIGESDSIELDLTTGVWCASYPRVPADMVNPDVEPLDWRAVCGRTARTVRREGRA